MYVHSVGVILGRDLEMSQFWESSKLDIPRNGRILHHILHQLLPLSVDITIEPNEARDKLSKKASCFLVVLCNHSTEERRWVISELVKALSSFSNLECDSLKSILSPDIAKSVIDGGMVLQCLASILKWSSFQVWWSEQEKSTTSNGRSDDQLIAPLAAEIGENNNNISRQQELMDAVGTEQRQPQRILQIEGNHSLTN